MNEIPVFFTFDERYVMPAAVTFVSMLENANPQNFYKLYVITLGKGISAKNQNRLIDVVNKFNNASLEFRQVEHDFSNVWKDSFKAHFSPEIFAKLVVASAFKEYDKIICTDVDVVFTGDVSEAFDYDISDFYMAGVQGIKKLDAFIDSQKYDGRLKQILKKGVGAGFLIYNLKKIRNDKMEDKLLNNLNKYIKNVTQPEQDILNITFENRIFYLPLKFVFCTYMYNLIGCDKLNLSVRYHWLNYLSAKYKNKIIADENHDEQSILEAFENPVQVHYATGVKPWNTLICFRKMIWMKNLFKTNFFMEFIIRYEIVNVIKFPALLLKKSVSIIVKSILRSFK